MTKAAWLTGAGALAVLVILGLMTTPWHLLPGVHRVAADGHLDFSAAELARETRFHHLLRPPSYLGMLLSVLVAALLGLTPLGSRLIHAVSGGRWWQGVLIGASLCLALPRIASMLAAVRVERVLREYGLSNQTWASWLADQLRSLGLTLVLTVPALLLLVWLARRWSNGWWIGAGIGAVALTFVVSFLYPVVVEPVYNHFESLPAGTLRTELLELAAKDHIAVKDVLVADASKRTTTENAYVSGFGSSRRIVLYDNLIHNATDEQVRLVVAHELGHVKHHDVIRGTALGALGGLAGVALLAAALSSGWLRSRAEYDHAADPRCIAAVLALAAIVSALVAPAVNLVSRQVEANADLHSLQLTHDPQTFVEVERRLALSNLSSLGGNHLSYALFATHPSSPDRIAMARTWATQHGVPVPPRLVPAP